MEGFVVILGVIGSLASIIALLLPAQSKRHRAGHVIYGLSIVVLTWLAFTYHQKVVALTAVERQAAALLKSPDLVSATTGSSRGIILASLSFLEKHKDRLPDTYARAEKLTENSGVLTNIQENGTDRLYQDWRLSEAAGAMKHLIAGIAAGQVLSQ